MSRYFLDPARPVTVAPGDRFRRIHFKKFCSVLRIEKIKALIFVFFRYDGCSHVDLMELDGFKMRFDKVF